VVITGLNPGVKQTNSQIVPYTCYSRISSDSEFTGHKFVLGMCSKQTRILYTTGHKLNVKYVKQHGNRAVSLSLSLSLARAHARAHTHTHTHTHKNPLWWYMNEEEKRKITNLERINNLVIHILQNGVNYKQR
jgi:hypothetical protein